MSTRTPSIGAVKNGSKKELKRKDLMKAGIFSVMDGIDDINESIRATDTSIYTKDALMQDVKSIRSGLANLKEKLKTLYNFDV